MSMPTFPETGLDISQEQAFNMLLTSIAMEELSLSHIMNAEGEKLQYVLGTLPGSHGLCATTQDLLDVNKSITNLLDSVMQNQIMLKGKLERILEAKERYCPPPPRKDDCKPCEPSCEHVQDNHGYMYLKESCRRFCWNAEHGFPWRCFTKSGDHMTWSEKFPCLINLAPGRSYKINFNFNFQERMGSQFCVLLHGEKRGSVQTQQVFKGFGKSLSGSAVCPVSGNKVLPIFFSPCENCTLLVENASVTVKPI